MAKTSQKHLKLKFVGSYPSALKDNIKSIVLLGRSNVGKSSLINFLANSKSLAFSSKKPGLTRLLNYYYCENNKFYLIDTPGYGYSRISKKNLLLIDTFMTKLLNDKDNISKILLIIDARLFITENDKYVIDLLKDFKKSKIIFIFNKYDKLSQSQIYYLNKKIINNKIDNYYFHSNLKKLKHNIFNIFKND